ncbi:MAG TPA: DUF433 domain-containing protein [Pyrinomonadaceae bacterium]
MSIAINTLLVSSPDVCGGRLRIDGTRITVNQIVVLYKKGYNAERIADEYPYLTMAQVYAALAHYHANQDEIEADLEAEREETNGQTTNALPSSLEKEIWLEAFKALQRNLSLTPAKAAEWQDAVREARR